MSFYVLVLCALFSAQQGEKVLTDTNLKRIAQFLRLVEQGEILPGKFPDPSAKFKSDVLRNGAVKAAVLECAAGGKVDKCKIRIHGNWEMIDKTASLADVDKAFLEEIFSGRIPIEELDHFNDFISRTLRSSDEKGRTANINTAEAEADKIFAQADADGVRAFVEVQIGEIIAPAHHLLEPGKHKTLSQSIRRTANYYGKHWNRIFNPKQGVSWPKVANMRELGGTSFEPLRLSKEINALVLPLEGKGFVVFTECGPRFVPIE